MSRAALAGFALGLFLGGCRTSPHSSGGGIQAELKAAFAKTNSRIAYVRILGVQPRPYTDDEYIVLATAGANTGDSVRFENELFGVFVAGSSLGHVRRVLDVFPSKRWHDYTIRFDTTSEGELEIVGAGETYGDAASHRVYDWSHGLIREYVAPGDTATGD